MIYTAIDNFYLTEEQLKDSPSRKDDIDEETENMLRLYGCELIQESGILLKLPQAVMATGQVLFHRFYCKKSFARFSVKRVAASCVWLASKLEESQRRSKSVILVFHRIECRRENLPIEFLDIHSKKFSDLKNDLVRTERHLLKEMGFICHVEHPHKFISNYVATLEAPQLTQEAWNLANDSLRTTLCVRFKSEVVACGVVYAAARRNNVALPEDPAWWTAFDADVAGVMEVCRVLAKLYSAPKARYISVYKDDDSFGVKNKKAALQESPGNASIDDNTTPNPNLNTTQAILSEETATLEELKDTNKIDQDTTLKTETTEPEAKDKDEVMYDGEKDKTRASKDRDRDRDLERERDRSRERERERRHHHYRKKDNKSSGHSDTSRRQSSRDRGDYYREKDRHRRNPY